MQIETAHYHGTASVSLRQEGGNVKLCIVHPQTSELFADLTLEYSDMGLLSGALNWTLTQFRSELAAEEFC